MSDFTFLESHYLYLLGLLPLWLLLGWYHHQQEKKQLIQFRQQPIRRRPIWRTNGFVLISLTSLVIALARPAWNPMPMHENEQGRDIIFLVDVSRSMLAADALPNRLDAARQAIRETVNRSKSDRFGLVAFAGSTVIKSPLTHDKSFFLYLLDQLSPNSVAHGGTRIEDALFKVFDKMIPKESESSAIDIVMLTDGEDLGSQPERAIHKLNQMNIRLLIVGLGDTEIGARVPSRDGKGWVLHEGRVYWSKMQSKPLREMTQEAEKGIFFPVGTANFDLAGYIAQLRQLWPGAGRSESQQLRYTEGYPLFLFLAALCQALLLLSRKQKLLIASLFALSFQSQAIGSEAPVNKDIPVQALELSEYSFAEIDQIAQSRVEYTPGDAAELYGYIAQHTNNLETAITANYNQAVSYIHYAENVSDALENEGILMVMDDELDLVEPITFYRRARDLLQKVLLHSPNHLASAKNLQYLMTIEDINKDLIGSDEGDQKSSDEGEGEQQEDQQEEQESESDSKNQQENQNDPQEGEQEDEMQKAQMEINELRLPPPNATAEEIISDAKQVDTYQRSPAPAKQSQVKQDW